MKSTKISKANVETLVERARKEWYQKRAKAQFTGHPKSWDAAEAAQDRLAQLELCAVELLGCAV